MTLIKYVVHENRRAYFNAKKTCVEYITKLKVSNLNFKQITRLLAIFHLFFEYLKPSKLEIHASQISWIFLFKYQSIYRSFICIFIPACKNKHYIRL
jgi:hypothetical protein